MNVEAKRINAQSCHGARRHMYKGEDTSEGRITFGRAAFKLFLAPPCLKALLGYAYNGGNLNGDRGATNAFKRIAVTSVGIELGGSFIGHQFVRVQPVFFALRCYRLKGNE